MGIENFIVQLKTPCNQKQRQQVLAFIKKSNGTLLTDFSLQDSFLITIDSDLRTQLEAIPHVALVGGIQMQPRPIRRIRVQQNGCTKE